VIERNARVRERNILLFYTFEIVFDEEMIFAEDCNRIEEKPEIIT
jgi:hypothetical protein